MKRAIKNISTVTKNHLCCSCGACSAICPNHSITFDITNSGRLIPTVDEEKCIFCGLCYRVCPGINVECNLNSQDIFLGNVISSYLGKTTNQEYFNNAQSGGMVTEVLSYLFDNELIKSALVVSMESSLKPKPRPFFATDKKDLKKSQRSIYLPINVLDALRIIDRVEGPVAVVGTGCHIRGVERLKEINPKVFGNIKYKLGLVCDRVLSYLSNEIFKLNEPYKIIYKDKNNPNYINANVTLLAANGRRITKERALRFWLKEYVTPSRCFICADKMNIKADFVFGDPWGLENYDKEKGESIVISRNKDAESIIKDIMNQNRAELIKVDYHRIIEGQKIALRKHNVMQSLAVYKELGLSIPEYFKTRSLPAVVDKNIKKQIVDFIKMEKRPKKKNIALLRRRIMKRHFILKVIFTVKLFLGRSR